MSEFLDTVAFFWIDCCSCRVSSQVFNLVMVVLDLKLLLVQNHSTRETYRKFIRWTAVTARNSSCGKVMFSQACVKNSVHRGGGMRGRGVHGRGSYMVGGMRCRGRAWQGERTCMRDSHWSGRYAAYWNVFLFQCPFGFSLRKVKFNKSKLPPFPSLLEWIFIWIFDSSTHVV